MARAIECAVALSLLVGAACAFRGGLMETSDGADADADADEPADLDGADEPDGDQGFVPPGGWPVDPPPDEDDPVSGELDGRYNELPERQGLCVDGEDASSETFADCEDAACLTSPGCCQDVGWTWDGGFDGCETLSSCGWSPFAPSGEPSSRLEPPWVLLGGDGSGESGLVTEPLFSLDERPTLSFVASLGPDGCDEGSCRQALGVALTGQAAVSGATGVEPSLGLVLDGELEAVHLYVSGRAVGRVAVPLAELRGGRTYAVRARPDGRVAFWVALPADGAVAAETEGTTPTFVTEGPVRLEGSEQRIAISGRLRGERGGAVGGLVLDRWLCDRPGGFEGQGTPARAPMVSDERAGRPSVALIPAGVAPSLDDDEPSLLMVFETRYGLAAATSWYGREFRFVGEVLAAEPSPTRYGRVARRAPALVYWGPTGGSPTWHLWFEGVSERAEGQSSAVLHAVSDDGLDWHEPPGGESIAVEGDANCPWRTSVGEPTVVATATGGLWMWFVGRDPTTGATSIGRATSEDGASWIVDGEPVRLEPDEPRPFERDGVDQPVVVRRGEGLHLWYRGRSGSRSAIGYAVAEDRGGTVFRRVASPALEAGDPWEGRRVGGPAALTLPSLEGPGAILHLWYEAGPEDHESIGLATRRIPAR